MAAPALVQAGTGNVWQSGGAVSVSLAGVTVGNIVVWHSLVDGVDNVSPFAYTNVENLAGTDSLLTAVTPGTGGAVGSAEAARQWLYIGRALTSAPSVSFLQGSGVDVYARLYEFSGVNTGTTLADVIENSSAGTWTNGAGTSGTIADTAVVTLGADRLACNFIAVNDDNQAFFDTEAFTGQTGGTWVSGGSYGSSTGTDGSIGLQTATMASAGTIDGGTLTMDSDAWGVIGFALIPASVVTTPSLVYNPNPQQYLQVR